MEGIRCGDQRQAAGLAGLAGIARVLGIFGIRAAVVAI